MNAPFRSSPLFALVMALLAVGSAGAEDGFEAIIPAGAERVEDVQGTLESVFEDAEMIRFQCRNGEFAGGDFDSALELNADGTAKLIEYGFAVIERTGTYEVNDDNALVVTLEDRPGWPAVAVYAAGDDLLLVPAAGTPDSVGEHNGVPVAEYAVTVWPYRQVALNGG